MYQLSDGAFSLLSHICFAHSVSWIWCLKNRYSNLPAIANLLIQNHVLKIRGKWQNKRICATKKGYELIKQIIPYQLAKRYVHWENYRQYSIYLALFIMTVCFLCLGYNRWYLLRYSHNMLLPIALGFITMPCFLLSQYDTFEFEISHTVEKENSANHILHLFYYFHFSWNQNLTKYVLSKHY